MTRAVLAAVALLSLVAGTARAAQLPAHIEFQAFSPDQIDVLPGDSVQWTNDSERTHTVTANDGSFDSGELGGGVTFTEAFTDLGPHPYHCTIHLGMTGEVDVRGVILDSLPPAAVPAGQQVELTGRTADTGVPVGIERDTGTGFQPVTSVTPAADGTWSAMVPAEATADYRAVSGVLTSQDRRLLVTDRHLVVTPTKRGVRVTVIPSDPGARVVLEVNLRERFGWWPQASKRLDYVSRADFRVHRPARVRVSLVDVDGWTPLVTSPELRLAPPRG
jgi:plastocyanin